MSGYARFHRSLIGHPAFRNDAEAMAFAYLVLRAQWKPARVRYKGKAIGLDRGQLAVSVRDLADAMDRDKGWIERLLKRLRAESMLATHAETGVLVITICNYEKYQRKAEVGETLVETPAGQGQDTEQEGEEGKKEVSPPTPRSGGRRGKTALPADWQLPPIADLPPKARACAEQWTRASYETHGEAFASYWRGTGKMMTDWLGTWANRVIALHSQVLRDQRFGNAPTDAKAAPASMTEAERAAYLRWLDDKPFLRGVNTPGAPPGPRGIGPLAAGIAGSLTQFAGIA